MKVQRLLLIASMSIVLFSCGNSDNNNNGDWVTKATFRGQPRVGAVGFSLNGLGYIGTGYDGRYYYNDFWVYNPTLNTWTEIDTIPGQQRAFGVGFATANYGYAGTGYNGEFGFTNNSGSLYANDFYQYNPATNTWVQIANIPTPFNDGREFSVAFGIPGSNMGGVLGGYDGQFTYADFYTWQESGAGAGTWVAANDYPGEPRQGSVSFVHNNLAYIVTGTGTSNQTVQTFFSYDPTQPAGSRWNSSLRRIAGVTNESYDAGYSIVRTEGVAFTMNNQGIPKGYVTFGSNGGNLTSCWEYDFATDLWTIKTPFPQGAGRVGGVGLSINDTGYVGLGGSTVNGGGTYYQDWTQFYPALPYNPDDYYQ
jgi:N-acetylneuraminic acid mutarotase